MFLSASVLVCCLQTVDAVRHFTVVSQRKNWADAQSYCREKFTDLATIQDAASNAEAQQVAGRGKFWIGLFNTSWRWSLGNEDVSLKTWYTKWAPDEPSPGYCVTISAAGLWTVRDCSVQYKFVCYNGKCV